jgi:hypothetical protein
VTFLLWVSANRPELMNRAWMADVARKAGEPLVNGVLTHRHRSVLKARVMAADPRGPRCPLSA